MKRRIATLLAVLVTSLAAASPGGAQVMDAPPGGCAYVLVWEIRNGVLYVWVERRC